MEHHINYKDRVSIAFLEWSKPESDVRSKLQDLYNTNIIVYTKAVFFEKPTHDLVSPAHIITRFSKPLSKRQLLKHFPDASLKKIASWKNQKELITTLAKNITKIIEIGSDNANKQSVKLHHHEKRMSTKTYEKASKSFNQSLYEIVELKKTDGEKICKYK